MALDLFFSPIQIGRMSLRNRLVFPPMVVRFAGPIGEVTPRLTDYLVARGAGGSALLIAEAAYVRFDGKGFDGQLAVDDDRLIPGLRHLADAVHATGAKLAVQLYHAGRYTYSAVIGGQPVGPSAIASPAMKDTPRALTTPEIQELVKCFGRAAYRAREAGLDAVEVHGSHGYLIAQFLSPFANHRTDEYGGSVENRARIGTEIVKEVKRQAGADYPVIFRINGEERVEPGLTLAEAKVMSRMLEAAGADAIHVSIGPFEARHSVVAAPMGVKGGFIAHLAKEIKSVVGVPVITVNRINDARLADKILRDGQADLVAMGRALLADPDLPNKSSRAAYADIRPCIGCNEGCVGGLYSQEVTCLVNPSVGFEREHELHPTVQPRKVLIAGGGPAGMEAARVAAARGHRVVLCERSDRLGGQFNLASAVPKGGEFSHFVRYQISQLEKAGVETRLGQPVTRATCAELKPDVIVVATGSRSRLPAVSGASPENLVSTEDVLAGKPVGEKVLILGAGMLGLDVADYLGWRGHKVTLLEVMESRSERAKPEGTRSRYTKDRLDEYGVKSAVCDRLLSISQGAATVQEGSQSKSYHGYDTLVNALLTEPVNDLVTSLSETGIEIQVVGDAARPGKGLAAVREGAAVGRQI